MPTDIPSTQGVGSKGQTISFSESSQVGYQIKADDAGSNMVANILPTDTPLTQGVGSKGQTISFTESSHVAYQRTSDSLNEGLPIKMARKKVSKKTIVFPSKRL